MSKPFSRKTTLASTILMMQMSPQLPATACTVHVTSSPSVMIRPAEPDPPGEMAYATNWHVSHQVCITMRVI